MATTDPWQDPLLALADPYRRNLLVALLDDNPQDEEDLDPLNRRGGTDATPLARETELVHVHLPKLAEMGFIEWDRATGEISKGPDWEAIAPIVQLLHEHREELPDGWL